LPAVAKQLICRHEANRLSGLLLFLILIATAFRLSARAAEPEYNGKTLGNWLILNLTGDPSSQESIRQIGTNGIPTFVDLLGVKDKNVKKVLSKLNDKNLTYYYKFEENTLDSQESLRKLGVNGFTIWEPMRNLPFRRSPKSLMSMIMKPRFKQLVL